MLPGRIIISLVAGLTIIAVGCQASGSAPAAAPSAKSDAPAKAAVPAGSEAPGAAQAPAKAAAPAKAEAPAKPSGGPAKRIVMSAGTQGGSVYTILTAFSSVLNKYVPGLEVSVRSGGTLENISLLDSGELELGGASGMDYFTVMNADPRQSQNIRTIFTLFPSAAIILVPKDSPAKSLADLKGKRLEMSDRRTGAYAVNKLIMEALGFKESDFQVSYLSVAAASDAFREGKLDAFMFLGGLPSSALMQMGTSPRGLKFLLLTSDEIKTVISRHPFLSENRIAPGALPGIDQEVGVVGYWSELDGNAKLADDLVYTIVKTLSEHNDDLVQIHNVAKTATAEITAKEARFRLHPGAERYFRERGLSK